MKQTQKFMLDKLATSLLTTRHASSLHIKAHTDKDAAALHLSPAWYGFVIPYFTLDGKKREFFRYRVDDGRSPERGFAALTGYVGAKYLQPAQSGCAAYFPPLLSSVTWRQVAEDPSIPICITEGELKAACACSLDVPTLGLGGVYNWRTADMRPDEMLPELEEIEWTGRSVVILYDSDIDTKPQVKYAAALLSMLLTNKGSEVRLAKPPYNPELKKTGLDDWLYSLPAGRAEALNDLLLNAAPVESSRVLHQLNTEIARIIEARDYVQIATGQRMDLKELLNETEYGGRTYTVASIDGKSKRSIQAVKTWATWPHKRTFKSYAYEPGKPRIIEPGPYYNTWNGLGVEPVKGDSGMFTWLISRLVPDPTLHTWFTQWLAAPLQQPGLKMQNSALLLDLPGGTGKSFLADIMEQIYGDNFSRVSSTDFGKSFNSYLEHAQFIVGDETSTDNKRGVSEFVKKLITSKTVPMERKYKDTIIIPCKANFLFFSNFPDAFLVADKDRRMFIHEVEADPLTEAEAKCIELWLAANGAAHALYYLQNEVSLEGFNPFNRPPDTEAKTTMIHMGYNSVRSWIETFKIETALQGIHLYTARQLRAIYFKETEDSKVDANWMGKELAKAGCRPAAHGSNVQVAEMESDKVRFAKVYIVGATAAQQQIYRNMAPKQIASTMLEQRAKPGKQKQQKFAQKVN